MTKNRLKYFVDLALYVCLCTITLTGLILGFIIPHGGGDGHGRRFLLLQRCQWGEIHLDLALFMVVLLGIHIFLNWSWVKATSSKVFGNDWKRNLILVTAGSLLILAISWILVWI